MRKLIIVVFTVVSLLLGAEFIARASQPPAATSVTDYYRSRPAAYANAPYFSVEFVAEMNRVPWQLNGAWWEPDTFNGQWFHTDQGERLVTDRPTLGPALYMLGNSPVFGPTVPDNLTIPSLLQTKLPQYRVINLGGNGNMIQAEYARLKSLPLQKGDTVIFYDGTAEAIAVYGLGSQPSGVCSRLRSLALFGWLCDQQVSAEMLKPIAEESTARYRETVAKARSYAESRGARFIHAIQPNLFTRSLSIAEGEIIANPNLVPDGLGIAFSVVYPLLYQPGDVDLSHALDSLRDTEAIYTDCCHTNERANAVIALALYSIISAPS